jgi:hypothetical protein
VKNYILLRRVVRKFSDPVRDGELCHRRLPSPSPGSAPGGTRPLRQRTSAGRAGDARNQRREVDGRRPEYTDGAPAQDGVNLGTVVRAGPRGTGQGATASNLDTQSRSRDRSMSVHAVEFSKTVAPLQEVPLPQGRSRSQTAGTGADRPL